jgi:hypothetical protein
MGKVYELSNCQLYHGENKLIFNEMMMRFALYSPDLYIGDIYAEDHWTGYKLFENNIWLGRKFSICARLKCSRSWVRVWDDDEVRFVLDQFALLDFYSARSLKQQSARRHVAPLGHIILIPGQPVFALSP